MQAKEKWLQKVGAIATSRGWVHPKTGELLKSAKLNIDTPTTESVVTQDENVVDDTTLPEETQVIVEQDVTQDEVLVEQKPTNKRKQKTKE